MNPADLDLAEAWKAVDRGIASDLLKVDAAWETGVSKVMQYQGHVLRLLDDSEGDVRRYALQCLVLDLQRSDDAVQKKCWQYLRFDPDEDVRAMAATCLGHVFLRGRSRKAFRSLEEQLGNKREECLRKAIYLFGLVLGSRSSSPRLTRPVRQSAGA